MKTDMENLECTKMKIDNFKDVESCIKIQCR